MYRDVRLLAYKRVGEYQNDRDYDGDNRHGFDKTYRDEHGNLKVGRLLGLTGHAFNRRAGNTAVAQRCAQGRTGTNQTCSKYRSYYHKSIFHL